MHFHSRDRGTDDPARRVLCSRARQARSCTTHICMCRNISSVCSLRCSTSAERYLSSWLLHLRFRTKGFSRKKRGLRVLLSVPGRCLATGASCYSPKSRRSVRHCDLLATVLAVLKRRVGTGTSGDTNKGTNFKNGLPVVCGSDRTWFQSQLRFTAWISVQV